MAHSSYYPGKYLPTGMGQKSRSAGPYKDKDYWVVDRPALHTALDSKHMACTPPAVHVDWDIFCPAGPQLAFHVACCIGNILYLHGGISQRGDIFPSNKLHKLDLRTMIWDEVRVAGSPALSHHACVALEARYILLIGGWNGQVRTSSVVAFDTVKEKWSYPEVTGFPEDAGLSSHTVSLLNSGSILVLGREGSLRMQPKDKIHGNAYMLTGSVKHGYQYTEYSHSTDSRSGHTTSFIGPTLYVLGGRHDNLVEVHRGYNSGDNSCQAMMQKLLKLASTLKPLTKLPSARRHHIAYGGPHAIFIHGGEKFEGPNRGPSGEMYIMVDKPNVNFYKLGVSQVNRSGHVCCNVGDMILLHGGLGQGKRVQGDTRVLAINFDK